ncbi:MAG TPA: DNA-formamidopyrimidine glycosylase family protein [Streptosporangiaceae bacterium]|nr:DNA-formamidopyrimidine glycosylase family protein [Streptosporangiaceae bacterium]
MPEGDVVWRVARELHAALAGRVLTRSDFRVPRFATADLTGRKVRESVSSGKHLLIRVDGDVSIHTHLRMDGFWRISQARAYPPRDHRVRLVLANRQWQAVGYQLGIVELLPSSRERQVLGHLGPDLLAPDWDERSRAEAVRRLAAQPDRPVGEALLDQANLAGLGNIYKTESLFLAGVNPRAPIGHAGDLAALVELARQLLDANKESARQITTGNPARGHETWVYRRAGRPCRRCGTPIKADGYGRQGTAAMERITFWCPACQPACQP